MSSLKKTKQQTKTKQKSNKNKPKENLTTSEISKAINFYLMFTEAYSTAWECR